MTDLGLLTISAGVVVLSMCVAVGTCSCALSMMCSGGVKGALLLRCMARRGLLVSMALTLARTVVECVC